MHFSGSNKKSSQFQEKFKCKYTRQSTKHLFIAASHDLFPVLPLIPITALVIQNSVTMNSLMGYQARVSMVRKQVRAPSVLYRCKGVLWTVLCRSGARWRSLCLSRTSRRSGQRWLSTSSPTSQRQPQTRSERKIGKWQISLKLLKKEGSFLAHDIL